jgi:hypothetical protein
VVFAAEPITDAFYAPWGIRSDGQTLWAMKRLDRRKVPDASSLATVFVARRSNEIAATDGGSNEAAKPFPDSTEASTSTLHQEYLPRLAWVKRILRPVTPIWARRFLIKVLRRISG